MAAQGTDLVLIQRGGVLYKLLASDIAALVAGLPAGGTAGQVLAKTSATDYAATWQTPSGGGSGITAAKAYAQNLLRLS